MAQSRSNHTILTLIIIIASIRLFFPYPTMAADEEETYNISLVQTAEVDKEIVTLDDKKVLTETYTAKEGDYIWSILREKKLLEKSNLREILSVLKKLNQSLSDIDLIHPGEKIIIPLVITPVSVKGKITVTPESKPVLLEDLENLEYYTIRPGDSLVKVIKDKYAVPRKEIYNEYLERLKKLNPDLKNLDHIYPGQKVRLPIYSPKIARAPIKKKPNIIKPADNPKNKKTIEIGKQLSELFNLLGEEWIKQGKHFIPLKTGGQIDLIAESYPIITLRNGKKVIIDLHNGLPEKMADLIISNWDNYSIVHLTDADTFNSALEKIFPVCNYNKIYSKNEGLVLKKNITIEITADWIIKLSPELSPEEESYVCINLIDEESELIPYSLDSFLKGLGIKFINYPPDLAKEKEIKNTAKIINSGEEKSSIIEKLLEIEGQTYSRRIDIPIYQGDDSDFNLIVKADYFFNRNNRDCIINLRNLGDDFINLLIEHRFLVLSLSEETTIPNLITETLNFLDVEYDDKDHLFYALPNTRQKNVKVIIPGIIFKDKNNLNNLISNISLPPEIITFLSEKVDRLLSFKNSAAIKDE